MNALMKMMFAGAMAMVLGFCQLPQDSPAPEPEPEPEPQTIAEIAAGNEDLSTLVTALGAATDAGRIDFLGAVSDPHADLTVFAPTNDAFAALGDTLDAALADPGGLLTDVLAYHVLGESLTGEELVHAGSATTLLGEDVSVEVRDGNVFVNDAQVVIADIEASNGIVHVIDAVLLPPAPVG
ncbi:MAG: fasciclin domain-containing protein [Acidimicrobiales bacterium]